jgi:hypothetical protein
MIIYARNEHHLTLVIESEFELPRAQSCLLTQNFKV